MNNQITPLQSNLNSFQTLNSAREELSPINSRRTLKQSNFTQDFVQNDKSSRNQSILNEQSNNNSQSSKTFEIIQNNKKRMNQKLKPIQNLLLEEENQKKNQKNSTTSLQQMVDQQGNQQQQQNIVQEKMWRSHRQLNQLDQNMIIQSQKIFQSSKAFQKLKSEKQLSSQSIQQQQNFRRNKIHNSTFLARTSQNSRQNFLGIADSEQQSSNQLQKFLNEKLTNAIKLGKTHRLKTRALKWLYATQSRRYSLIKNEHYEILNDLSIIQDNTVQNSNQFDDYQNENQIQKDIFNVMSKFLGVIDQFIGNLFYCIEPMHPINKKVLYMNIVENIFIIFLIWVYTMNCVFDFWMEEIYLFVNFASLLVYLLSIVFKINTGYFEQGKVVTEKKKLVAQYRKNTFLYDLVAFVGIMQKFILSFNNNNDSFLKYLELLIYSKYFVFIQNLNKIEDRMNLRGNQVYVWTLLKLLSSSISICHIVASLYFLLAKIEKNYLDDDQNWVTYNGLEDSHAIVQYIQSFYWAISTISLIGSKGQTDLETLFCIITLLGTVGVFATILSTFTMVWEAKEVKHKEFKKAKDVLNQFFSIHSLSQDLYGQMLNYLQYSFQGHKEKSINKDFEVLLNKFPKNLQEMVQVERYSKDVQEIKIIQDNFSETSVKSMIQELIEDYFMPNQIIYNVDEQEEYYLYFILAGEVEIYQETEERYNQIAILKQGQFFGYNSFFTNQPPKYSAKSQQDQYTSVIKISRSLFLDIVSQRQEDQEQFMMIKQQLCLQGYSNILKIPCLICKQLYHSEDNCNLLNYVPISFNVIKRYLHYTPQIKRDNSIKRNQFKQVKTRLQLKQLKDARYEIQIYGGSQLQDKIEEIKSQIKSCSYYYNQNDETSSSQEDSQSSKSSNSNSSDPETSSESLSNSNSQSSFSSKSKNPDQNQKNNSYSLNDSKFESESVSGSGSGSKSNLDLEMLNINEKDIQLDKNTNSNQNLTQNNNKIQQNDINKNINSKNNSITLKKIDNQQQKNGNSQNQKENSDEKKSIKINNPLQSNKSSLKMFLGKQNFDLQNSKKKSQDKMFAQNKSSNKQNKFDLQEQTPKSSLKQTDSKQRPKRLSNANDNQISPQFQSDKEISDYYSGIKNTLEDHDTSIFSPRKQSSHYFFDEIKEEDEKIPIQNGTGKQKKDKKKKILKKVLFKRQSNNNNDSQLSTPVEKKQFLFQNQQSKIVQTIISNLSQVEKQKYQKQIFKQQQKQQQQNQLNSINKGNTQEILGKMLINLIQQGNEPQNLQSQQSLNQNLNNESQNLNNQQQSMMKKKQSQALQSLLRNSQSATSLQDGNSNNILQHALNMLQQENLQNSQNQQMNFQNFNQLTPEQMFYDMDSIWNFRFFFIYNNSEFTIPSYNKYIKNRVQNAINEEKKLQQQQKRKMKLSIENENILKQFSQQNLRSTLNIHQKHQTNILNISNSNSNNKIHKSDVDD